MDPELDIEAAMALEKFVVGTVALYRKGVLTEKQFATIWHETGVNVTNAEQLWANAASAASS